MYQTHYMLHMNNFNQAVVYTIVQTPPKESSAGAAANFVISRVLLETCAFAGGAHRVGLQAFGHLVAYQVDQAFKHLLDVDIFFGAGLEELHAELVGELLAAFRRDDFVFQVAFVADQYHLGVVPRVGLDLSGPVVDLVERVFVRDVVH